MTRPDRRDAPLRRAVIVGLFALIALGPAVSPTFAQGLDGRQVTVFGVVATPGQGVDDPKLKEVLPQLRQLVPGHSFRLLKVESKRLVAGETVNCDLGAGFVATSQLSTPIDANGKIQMRFDLTCQGISQYQTIVTTPPNQIFYINRMLPNGERLIIGIGAR